MTPVARAFRKASTAWLLTAGSSHNNVMLSGTVPQISLICGPCAGGAAYSPALTDFVIQTLQAQMFITGPQVIKQVTGEVVTAEELGGPQAQMNNSGVVHFIAQNDDEALQLCRRLLSFLPSNNLEDAPRMPHNLPLESDLEMKGIVPVDTKVGYDVRRPPGRAARPAAHRRGHHGADPLRLRPHRPHPVHRRRGVPPGQAQRPDARAARPVSHPGRVAGPGQGELRAILTEPKGALTKQYEALLATEGVELSFQADAVDTLAEFAFQVNQTTQNIGARRLYTIMERLLEELSFEAPDMGGGRVPIDSAYVKERLAELTRDETSASSSCRGQGSGGRRPVGHGETHHARRVVVRFTHPTKIHSPCPLAP